MRLLFWCLGLSLLAAAQPAAASLTRDARIARITAAHKKKAKGKKSVDKCDSIGKPCKEGDDCKPDNCKPGGQAPAPEE